MDLTRRTILIGAAAAVAPPASRLFAAGGDEGQSLRKGSVRNYEEVGSRAASPFPGGG